MQFKFIVNPCQYKSTLLPIQCQFAADSGQPTSNAAQIQPIYQSDFPMPIRDQSANPGQICQFIPFFPIHCRSDGNPDPIKNQSMVNPVPIKVNPPPMQHKSGQFTNLTFQCLFVTRPPIRDKFANSFHFPQSIAEPMAIHTQSRTNHLPI